MARSPVSAMCSARTIASSIPIAILSVRVLTVPALVVCILPTICVLPTIYALPTIRALPTVCVLPSIASPSSVVCTAIHCRLDQNWCACKKEDTNSDESMYKGSQEALLHSGNHQIRSWLC